jgi:hypothetical protein
MSMRLPVLSLFLVTAALLGATKVAFAQLAYSYPWCFYDVGRTDHLSCAFTSREQCMATLWGIGGICTQSPYYHPQPAPRPVHAAKRSRIHRPA